LLGDSHITQVVLVVVVDVTRTSCYSTVDKQASKQSVVVVVELATQTQIIE
jgi:hypothetical protein